MSGGIDPHDSSSTVTPSSPAGATVDLPDVPDRPSTPERANADPHGHGRDGDSANNNDRSSSSPTSSPSSQAAGAQPTSSPNQPPSRRVKVYKLKDDAWVDLGTGTCRGVLNHNQSPPGDMEEVGKKREKVDPDDEGAWIVVTRETPSKPSTQAQKSDPERDDSPSGAAAATAAAAADDGDDDDEKNVILRTRVQPYPPGYSEDFDEEELLEGEDGQTLDVGGYQRQQDTLIVWTERPDSGDGGEEMEMALSFATSTGCAEMWEFIKAARRFTADQALLLSPSPSPSLSSPRSFPMHANFTPSASSSSQLPLPTLGSIPQLETSIRALSRTAISRERLAVQILKSKFIERLIEVHEEAEDLESLEDLHAMCRVMQTILLLNDNSIFEFVLQDEIILGVVGILEYDPDFPSMKASYKSHLSSPKSFISLVPISSPTLLSKIHQTHRLHYLKDVVLARILEDSTFSMLNSAIYFNEVEIVNEVVTGERDLVAKVFDILNGDDDDVNIDHEGGAAAKGTGKGKGKERELGPKRTEIGPELPATTTTASSEDKKGEQDDDNNDDGVEVGATGRGERKQQAIQFLTQLSQMAKNLQLPLRTSLYRTLVERGLLSALENALRFANDLKDVGLRGQVIAIWMSVVDLDAKDVRAYCLKQGKDKEAESETTAVEDDSKKLEQTMLGGLIETFKVEEDLGIKTHLAEALRVLLDAAGESGPLEAPPRLRAPEDPEAEKFLQYFYDHYILSLLEPLLSLPERTAATPGPLDLSPASTALLSHLCDLLCFFICHHSFRSKYLILSSPQLAKSISNVLRPRPRLTRHTHLRLAALRFLRSCVARNDDFYNRFLIKHDLVKSVVETAVEERDRDNLLGSACLEFFEYVRSTNAKGLINHLMDRCGESIRKLAVKLKTFEGLVSRWEINNEPPPPPPLAHSSSTLKGSPGGSGENGSGGATSEAMQRQTSKPGWPAVGPPPSAASGPGRMDVEEESYFNTEDDEDDDDNEADEQIAATDGTDASSSSSSSSKASAQDDEPTTTTTSVHFASSRRKREPTSNPALSSSSLDGGAESKRVKLDDEVDDDSNVSGENASGAGGGGGGGGSSTLPRSQTWPQGSSSTSTGGGGAGGLVDYMDEDEDDVRQTSSPPPPPRAAAGGFIRDDDDDEDDAEGERNKHDDASSSSSRQDVSTTTTKPRADAEQPTPSPLTLLPGALKRKQEEEEEAEGLGGLLRAKPKLSSGGGGPTNRPSSSSPSRSLSPGTKLTTKPMTAMGSLKKATRGTTTTKPGGFKIAFGASVSKAAGTGLAPVASSTPSTSKSVAKEEEPLTAGTDEDKDKERLTGGGGGGFGKFGTTTTTTTTTGTGPTTTKKTDDR